jgi:DNA replication protein DnaC
MGSSSEIAFFSRALKAPRIAALAASLAERARSEGWDHETYLAQVLSEEVASRESHGGDARVRAAHFPQVKTLDDFDFSFQRSVRRQQISHLAQLDFLREATNVVFLGPPGTGKTHCETAYTVRTKSRGRIGPAAVVMTRSLIGPR